MPKGMNSKAEAARERKASSKADSSSKAEKDAEDAYWRSQGEGSKSKAQAKKEEQDKQRLEAAAKKAEAKRLAELEEQELSKPKAKKAGPAAVGKVTKFQLEQQRALDEKLKAEELKEKEMAAKRALSAEHYDKMVNVAINNKEVDVIEASSVTEALAVLGVADKDSDEKHPEKRMKAAWLAFQERELPALKLEKPGLRINQYKEMLWKAWQKHPDNPIVQAQRQQQGLA